MRGPFLVGSYFLTLIIFQATPTLIYTATGDTIIVYFAVEQFIKGKREQP